ncbi:Shikimate dehydrogenase [Candidatus Providencia siddallii]|uniref:Shikimate dehydrogenase (NADP(+)) n=1 Tax=Candidatus Providencia siddallii TaxID=1715285 RepID=A0A0M6WAB9_9GAMM|nr:Shikimate dehydrogenase [Candidatus Providencia siddallii]
METFAIFGNPLQHSKSPFIHRLFAQQCNKFLIEYKKILTTKKKFKGDLINFFSHTGKGANITSPFKENAFQLVSNLTRRAKICGAVNTILKLDDNSLLGDNTDGIGLLLDLKRIKFIHRNSNVLVIGAGGAVRGLLLPLLEYGCNITLTNRTFYKAEALAQHFTSIRRIKTKKINHITSADFNLIINATSSSMNSEIPKISSKIFSEYVSCYDIFYQNEETPFLSYAKNNKSNKISNGLGMFINQAAFSFELWFGVLPKISPILSILKNKNIINNY